MDGPLVSTTSRRCCYAEMRPKIGERAADLERAALAMARSLGMALAPPLDPEARDRAARTPRKRGRSAPSVARVSIGRSSSRVTHSAPATARACGTWRVCSMRPARSCTRSSWRGWGRLRRPAARSKPARWPAMRLAAVARLLDAAAKAAYRQRLADLRSDLAEAEAWNDPGRAERSQTEIDALTRELAAATASVAGTGRPVPQQSERESA